MTENVIKKEYDVVIAGGGASGMTAACFCAAKGASTCIIDNNRKLGRKLSVTGNGKCNISNLDMNAEKYPGADSVFVESLLSEYSVEHILEWFKTIGIICKERLGYLYPMSEQASSVAEALENELKRLKVDIYTETEIKEIKPVKDGFITKALFAPKPEKRDKKNDKKQDKNKLSSKSNNDTDFKETPVEFISKRLILSTGGPAAPVYGAADFGFKLLKGLGHAVTEPLPALVPLTVEEAVTEKLSGVRLEAGLELVADKTTLYERGEIIFNDKSISGIPVFQLSRHIARKQDTKKAFIYIDFLPQLSAEEFKSFLQTFSAVKGKHTYEQLLRGVLNYKIVYYLLLNAGIDPEANAVEFDDRTAEKITALFKHFKLTVTGTKDFTQAQVCTGGLALSEVYPDTLESKKLKGLYITGELLDVDGICGGYNLHFAWATGMRAGKNAGAIR